MESILMSFVIIIGIIIVASIVNEKKLHIEHDIAIISFSFLISLIVLILEKFNIFSLDETILGAMKNTSLDNFLLECTLGFMLFAGSSKIHLNKFMKNIIPITSLAVIGTVISSLLYGSLFYLVTQIFNINISIWVCMLLGALISPTDPIAATRYIK